MLLQAERKRYTLKEWEEKLSTATVRKEDMNELVMNFLVTEVSLLSSISPCNASQMTRAQPNPASKNGIVRNFEGPF